MKKTTIQIKSLLGKVLFEHTVENNTFKKTVEEAVNTSADLSRADLFEADLSGADLFEANLSGADLTEAKDWERIKHKFQIIPEEGSFVAWKKCKNRKVVKLQIPAKAKRTCNIINRKCRSEFVKTLGIYDVYGNKLEEKKATGIHDWSFIYEVGKITTADFFDDDMTKDCTNGIHFFVTFEEAKNW
jgi:hypothetical protein